MKTKLVALISILALVACPWRTRAVVTTYWWVSPTGSGTSCGNTTPTIPSVTPCPLDTVITGGVAIAAGDVVFARSGTYIGKHYFTASGSAGNPIVLRTFPGDYPSLAKIDGYSNTTLNGAITASQTTATLTDGTNFPANTGIEIDSEMLYIESKSSTNVVSLLNRAQGGTDGGAAAHANGAVVKLSGISQITVTGNNVTIRDMEIMSNDPVREYNRTLSDPSAHRGAGFTVLGNNVSILNCIIHDNRDGIYGQSTAQNLRIAGNVFYDNGLIDVPRGHGQTIYLQNDGTSTKTVFGNYSTNGFGEGMEGFGQSGPVSKLTFDSNISTNAGASNQYPGNPAGYSTTAGQANLFLGSSSQAIDLIVVQNNFLYHRFGVTGGNLGLGSGTTNLTLTVLNNYALGGKSGFTPTLWTDVTASGNTVHVNGNAAGANVECVNANKTGAGVWAVNNNTYSGKVQDTGGTDIFAWAPSGYTSFATYKTNSSQDAASTFTANAPSTNLIKYVPNADLDANSRIMGLVAVFNGTGGSTVSIDLTQFAFTNGDTYAIYAGENFDGTALATGTYSGGSATVSMSGTTVTAPIGLGHTPATTRPEFQGFIVIKTAAATGGAQSVVSGKVGLSGKVKIQHHSGVRFLTTIRGYELLQ